MNRDIEAIHDVWFGQLDAAGLAAPEHQRLWFNVSEKTDRALQSRFGRLLEQALVGELEDWAGSAAGLVALVLLLDQFTRNCYRGTPRAFAGDSRALALARQAIAGGRHRQLPLIHRVFLYLPLEHAEEAAAQQQCVALFAELVEENGSAQVRDFSRYAVAHQQVIERFGRFPHRNAILGRTSSAEELAHLAQHGGF